MSQPPAPQYRLTLRVLWLLVVPLGLLIRLNVTTIDPNDFWWHVRTGQITLANGAIPQVDLFSYTQAGQPWVNQAWLMQIVLAQLMAWGGVPLTIFVHALVITAGYTAILWVCAPRYGVRISVLALLLGAAVGLQNWGLRPQTFSFLAFGLLLALIQRHHHGQRSTLWLAVPLFALWVNAHGGFIFGLALLGLYVVAALWDAWRSGTFTAQRSDLLLLCAQSLLAVAALALNPQGLPGMVDYVLGFLQSKATVAYNQEFGPLIIRNTDGIVFAATTFFLIAARLRSHRPFATVQLLWLLAFGLMTLMSRRTAPWYGMALIPILADQLQGWWRTPRPLSPGKPALNIAIAALLLLLTAISLPWLRPAFPTIIERRPFLSDATPVVATTELCTLIPPGSRGYQTLAFASYLPVGCPDLPVFIDTRFELYTTEQWDDYIDFHTGRYNWHQHAQAYGMDYLFVSPVEQPDLAAAAEEHPAWQAVYEDEQAIIFRKAP